ncbi:MAG: hypothetical protein K6E22_05335 [Treponema sp.]|jgi:hypothetical protein|nr:hypothetical protein [Treponema sp.]MCR5317634.1 hypothetical protein [Treponema sp.]
MGITELTPEIAACFADLDMEFVDAAFSGKTVQKIQMGEKLFSTIKDKNPEWDFTFNEYPVESSSDLPEFDHLLVLVD